MRTAHPGFERLAPVIRELLTSKDGLAVRLTANEQRRQSALAAVGAEVPGLDAVEARHVAAALQLLTSAAAWQTLHDYWDMDGDEAGETAALGDRVAARRCPRSRRGRSPTGPTHSRRRRPRRRRNPRVHLISTNH